MVSLARIRSYITQVLHLRESPHKTALAFAVGAFIAFSPTYGLHTLMAVFCAWAFRLNFIALMAGALINNPWTVVPILGATFWTGFTVLGFPQAPAYAWKDFSLQSLYEYVMPYAWPFLIGGLILSVLGALLSYPAAYAIVSKYRAHRPQEELDGQRLPPPSSLR